MPTPPATAMAPEKQKQGEAKTQPPPPPPPPPPKKDVPDTDYGVKFAALLGYVPAPSTIGPPKVHSLDNIGYKPGAGQVRIIDRKMDFNNTKSKYDSKANLHYKSAAGDIAIMDEKFKFKEESKPKVYSLQNAKQVPGGGDVKLKTREIPRIRVQKS